MRRAWIFLAVALLFLAPASARLSHDVVPRRYDVRIVPDLAALRFSGSEDVAVDVRTPARRIVLNALGLEVGGARLDGVAGTVTVHAADETVALEFPRAFRAGRHLLHLAFSGRLGRQEQGLHLVRYGNATMLATQMEPADARRMLPCWDEPDFRAVFRFRVRTPHGMTAFSNMPAVKTVDGDTIFADTPPMASYLIAVVVGDLESISSRVDGSLIRVVTVRGTAAQGRWALESASRLLAWYNQWFGVPYPLPKLDLIAVPHAYGAMENWGAIVFGDNLLLYDPAKSSLRNRIHIFDVVAHEMAHQWFGDLVTMRWWDDLWLNEAFASWMSDKATAHFHPEWHPWMRFVGEVDVVMNEDARATTHPIHQAILSPAEADSAFDNITYTKGEAIIRMLEAYLGEDAFQAGIRRYIAGHRYGNATTAELWAALSGGSGPARDGQVSAVAATWIRQPGLPLVRAEESGGGLSLSQERFAFDPDLAPLEWRIPVTMSGRRKMLLTSPLRVPVSGRTLIDPGATGYYRVQYDSATFTDLVKDLGRLSAVDRLRLLGDTWALAEAGKGSARDWLALVAALPRSPDETWTAVADTFLLLEELGSGAGAPSPQTTGVREAGLEALRPILAALGWSARAGEAPRDSLLRARLIGALGWLGDPAVVDECERRFDGAVAMAPDVRDAVYAVVGRCADGGRWARLRALGKGAASQELRSVCYRALAGARDPVLAARTLELTLGNELPDRDAVDLVSRVAWAGHSALAWKFFVSHEKALLGRLERYYRYKFVRSVIEAQWDPEGVRTWTSAHLPAEAGPEVSRALDYVRFKIRVERRVLPAFGTKGGHRGRGPGGVSDRREH
jgi:aminopeptidase N